jgi:hypothetical protein
LTNDIAEMFADNEELVEQELTLTKLIEKWLSDDAKAILLKLGKFKHTSKSSPYAPKLIKKLAC